MALFFKSTLDDSAFTAGLRRMAASAKGAASTIGAGMKGAAGGAIGGALAVGSIVAAGKAVLDFAGDIADNSEAVGINAEKFQKLSGVFLESGVNMEKFTKGMATLNEKLQDAKDGTGTARERFEQLGITWADIKSKSPDQILLMVADGLKNAKDPAAAFSAALELVGAKQLKMVSALKQGSEAIQEQANGISALSNDRIAQLDIAGDRLTKFGQTLMVAGGEAIAFWGDILGGGKKEVSEFQKRTNQLVADMAKVRAAAKAKRIAESKGGEGALKSDASDPESMKSLREFEAQQKKQFEAEQTTRAAIDANIADANEISRKGFEDSLSGQEKINLLESERNELLQQQMLASELEASVLEKKIRSKFVEIEKEKELLKLKDEALKKDSADKAEDAAKKASAEEQAKEDRKESKARAKDEIDDTNLRELAAKRRELAEVSNEESPMKRGLASGKLGGGGYNVVRRGDAARRKQAEKDAAAERLDKTNEILDEIKRLTLAAWGDGT